MCPTLLLTDPDFLGHRPGPTHPEAPERLVETLRLLERLPIPGVEREMVRPAKPAEVLRVHAEELVHFVDAQRGRAVAVDPDTHLSVQSHAAIWKAAGASVQAVEALLEGRASRALSLVRPPGHHAEPTRAMGFCLFNNVAIAAEAALAQGLSRVLVLDWDVHHGNGTQAAFWHRPDVLFLSVHQAPLYPGTGAVHDVGGGPGIGYTVNCPLPEGCTDADYGAVFESLVAPLARAYCPQLVLVSAGFDAHAADPLGGMRLTERGFAAMCTFARRISDEFAQGRLALVLEGGYDLGGLSRSVHACVEVLTGRDESFPSGVSSAAARAVEAARAAIRPFWQEAFS